jgi:hypothetical protein
LRATEAVSVNFARAAKLLGLTRLQEIRLLTPKREVKGECTAQMDDGSVGTFIGYGVQHDDARRGVRSAQAVGGRAAKGRARVRRRGTNARIMGGSSMGRGARERRAPAHRDAGVPGSAGGGEA